ncbi:hypothetical protein PANT111_210017 [Pantoea brenneri]|uniref:Secreted protein n=1 Tax=Pantoea brenneri TaxID=472694 RepID=A0AAX3J7L0_9GAMM|nr:hypothetical protein PANT111_210017 [Pantoea brenneri]
MLCFFEVSFVAAFAVCRSEFSDTSTVRSARVARKGTFVNVVPDRAYRGFRKPPGT